MSPFASSCDEIDPHAMTHATREVRPWDYDTAHIFKNRTGATTITHG
jgi:hypothetical protein